MLGYYVIMDAIQENSTVGKTFCLLLVAHYSIVAQRMQRIAGEAEEERKKTRRRTQHTVVGASAADRVQ
jgi:hypothetical protein